METDHWYRAGRLPYCDEDRPNVITDVATTAAPVPDFAATGAIQDRLAGRGLPPREHLVDAGYVTAAHLLRSRRDHACELLGPVAPERGWQARAGQGYAAAQFVIDWEEQRATCPQGKPSAAWTLADDADGHPVVIIRFGLADCRACPVRTQCVSSSRERVLRLRRREEYEALRAARQRQATPAFKEQYATRAGVEGTISQFSRRLRAHSGPLLPPPALAPRGALSRGPGCPLQYLAAGDGARRQRLSADRAVRDRRRS